MNLLLIFGYIIFGTIQSALPIKITQATLGVHDRIAVLKYKINEKFKTNEDLKRDQPTKHAKTVNEHAKTVNEHAKIVNENVEYIDLEGDFLTPINERDPRKKKKNYRVKEIKTTPGPQEIETTTREREMKSTPGQKKMKPTPGQKEIKATPGQNLESSNKQVHSKSIGRNKARIRGTNIKSKAGLKKSSVIRNIKKTELTDVFYRREFGVTAPAVQHWVHCHDLITPIVTGFTKNITNPKLLTSEDKVVKRLIHLITEDVTNFNKNDLQAILYQISDLKLRLFQWDSSAMKIILRTIIKGSKKATFKSLKKGLKALFNRWKLNYAANVTILIKQTRMFRPPCVVTSEYEGSTKKSQGFRYTKSVKPKKVCRRDDSDESCY